MSESEKPAVGLVITNALTGQPMKKTPAGLSLEGVTFKTKEELLAFVDLHWTEGKGVQAT